MITGNLLTIDDDPPFGPDNIPDVPTAGYLYAKGGEKTYALDPSCRFCDGKPVIVHEKIAEPGEILRDVDLKFRLDISKNVAYRMQVRAAADKSEEVRKIQQMLCRSSIVYFCNVWCWTYVPGLEAVPFILYDFQTDLITWIVWAIKNRFPILVEKSRNQGLSWLTRVVHAWLLLFFRNNENYSLSLGKAEVDNRQRGSLFGKQRYLLRHLPEWMRAGWREYAENIDNIMKIGCPYTDSVLIGLLTGSTAGRSGRGSFADYDEFAHVQTARETLESSAQLAWCELYISTVKGMGNPFAEMAHMASTIKKRIHWHMNPVLNKEWAVKERAKPKYYTQEIWNQEMEIDYQTSTSGRVFPQLISSVSYAEKDERWCHLQSGDYFEYDPAYTVHIGMDFGFSDPNTIVFAQIKAPPLRFQNKFKKMILFFDEHSMREQPFQDYDGKEGLVTTIKSRNYRYETYVGDLYTADKTDNYTGKQYINLFRGLGIHLVGKRNTVMAPIEVLKGWLEVPGAVAINKDRCPGLIEALQNWSYPTDDNGLPIPGMPPQAHSQYSHYCKAICYFMDYMFGKEVEKKKHKPFKWGVNLVKRARL